MKASGLLESSMEKENMYIKMEESSTGYFNTARK